MVPYRQCCYGVLGSAKTGLKRLRGRQPRLERHVGFAWLYCYAAYKLSRAQLIPTSKPEHCRYATIFIPPAHPVGILRGKVPCYSFFWSGRCVPPTLTPLPTPLATTPNPSATCPVTGSIPAPFPLCTISLFLQPTTDHGDIGNAPLRGCPFSCTCLASCQAELHL
jgi:hypothetical protein